MATKNFSLFLALRYVRPKRTFVSIITVISILGVTLGVMVPIIVLSVMTGFEKELEQKVIGTNAHVMIDFGRKPTDDWWNIAKMVEKQKDVVGAAPFVQGPVLLKFGNVTMAPKIRAIEPELEDKVSDMSRYIIDGQYDLDGDKAILGSDLAAILNVHVGDKVILYSPKNVEGLIKQADEAEKSGTAKTEDIREIMAPTELEVSGIFESGYYSFDSEFLLIPLHIGQEVYGLGGAVHGLSVKMTDRYKASELRDTLNEKLDPNMSALTWFDLNSGLFQAIETERLVMFFIMLFIALVAAFGIMNTLITVTMQKTREIGVLKALGARTSQVIQVFFVQGVFVAATGTLSGLFAAMFVIQFRNEFARIISYFAHREIFSRQIYEFSSIPAKIVPGDVALVCITAFVICSLAALIPAWFAARLDPVKALRYE